MPAARPILFSGPMIRALILGRKTQTRRIMKPKPTYPDSFSQVKIEIDNGEAKFFAPDASLPFRISVCPYGRPGDLLWVRESFISGCHYDGSKFGEEKTWYRADGDLDEWQAEDGEMTDRIPWMPSIHMPRRASRLTLEITDVRVERLQDISEEDAAAEGLNRIHHGDGAFYWHYDRDEPDPKNWIFPDDAFQELWTKVNGADSWDANPWVWALTFEVHQCNVDALLQQKAA